MIPAEDIGSNQNHSNSQSSKLAQLLERYLESIERGDCPDRDALIAEYPELSRELADNLAKLEALHQAALELGDDTATSALLLPGKTKELGDFQILRAIGRGGMGVVYEAEQISLGRRVALKVLPFAAMLDERHLTRFKNEARAAAMLKHPHIVSVLAVGCERGVHYYAMELVEGQSLEEVIAGLRRETERPVSRSLAGGREVEGEYDTQPVASLSTQRSTDRKEYYRSVARCGIQAAEALDYAHQMGVVHRDVKPSNLLIDGNAHLWVTDFGLAMTQNEAGLTITGDVVGTLRYMSPEQSSGQRGVVDQRTDVYSLGASLYELITLQPAVLGDDRRQLLRKLEHDAPIAPRKIDPSCPYDLETIVVKAIAKSPLDRYGTAGEMAADLHRFLEDRPVLARRTSIGLRAVRWTRRNRIVAGLGALVACLLLCLAVGGPLVALRQLNLKSAAEESEQSAKRELYDSRMNQAHAAFLDGEFETTDRLLREYLPPNADHRLRGFEWFYLWKRCQASLQVPTLRGGTFMCVDFSPDNRMLAYGTHRGDVYLSDRRNYDRRLLERNSKIKRRKAHSDMVTEVRFAPHGRWLVTASRDGTLRIWSTEDDRMLCESSFSQPVGAVALSPQADAMAVGFDGMTTTWLPDSTPETEIVILRLSEDLASNSLQIDAEVSRPLKGPFQRVQALGFSPDGQLLAAGCGDGKVRLWQTDGFVEQLPIEVREEWAQSLDFSPDGSLLAVGSGTYNAQSNRGAAEVWSLGSRKQLFSLDGHGSIVSSVAFAPDGSKIVTGCRDNKVRVWDVAAEKLLHTFHAHSSQVMDVAFAPDGKTVASCSTDQRIRLWDVGRLLPPERMSGPRSTQEIVFSPDGKLAAFCGGGGQVMVRDAVTAEVLWRQETNADYIASVAFSPDGILLATAGGHFKSEASGQVLVWNAWNGTLTQTLYEGSIQASSTAFSPDGETLAAAIGDTVQLWGTSTWKPAGQIVAYASLWKLDFSPDSSGLLASSCHTHVLQLWDTRQLTCLRTIHLPEIGNNMGIDFSPDGQFLAIGGAQGQVSLREMPSGSEVRKLGDQYGKVWSVAYSPDGRRLVSVATDGVARLWNVETGNALLSLRDHVWYAMAAQFSPDGRTLMTGDDGYLTGESISVWRAATDAEVEASLKYRPRRSKLLNPRE